MKIIVKKPKPNFILELTYKEAQLIFDALSTVRSTGDALPYLLYRELSRSVADFNKDSHLRIRGYTDLVEGSYDED